MNAAVGVVVLTSLGALAVTCALAVVVGKRARQARRLVRRQPKAAPQRCPTCGELLEHHAADWRRTTWQRGGIEA